MMLTSSGRKQTQIWITINLVKSIFYELLYWLPWKKEEKKKNRQCVKDSLRSVIKPQGLQHRRKRIHNEVWNIHNFKDSPKKQCITSILINKEPNKTSEYDLCLFGSTINLLFKWRCMTWMDRRMDGYIRPESEVEPVGDTVGRVRDRHLSWQRETQMIEHIDVGVFPLFLCSIMSKL